MLLSKPMIYSLPYFEDSAQLFEESASQPWAVFLDSGFPRSKVGRFDIMAMDPVCTIMTHGDRTTITTNDGEIVSAEDPFLLLKQNLIPQIPALDGLPFCGGAIGYFSYDLARRLEKLPNKTEDAEQIAEMAVGIYPWAVVIDHLMKQSYLVGSVGEDKFDALIQRFSKITDSRKQTNFKLIESVSSNLNKADYAEAIDKIKNYLREGDCYQVNMSQRFQARCQGDAWDVYLKLRKFNAAPYSGYINTPEVQILSTSPERFLLVKDGMVETKPIKGTRPRKQNDVADRHEMQELAQSSKDRAENLMIVDLLRNDISKTCKKNSVKVPKLFDIESYATVHHLVSTITGELKEDQHAVDLLKTCFPGGSITGAPKIRAMEIIEELEQYRRGVYCGSIGYIGFDGNMDTNIAIRTLVHSSGSIRFWAGGGIVIDSEMEEEYQECFDKAAALLAVLNEFKD